RIGFQEGAFDLASAKSRATRERSETLRRRDHRLCARRGVEIVARRKPRAGAVLSPFVTREPYLGIDVERPFERHARRGRPKAAVLRKTMLILRPKSMQDEAAIGPRRALRPAAAMHFAITRRPGERQDKEVEIGRRDGGRPAGRGLLVGAAIENAVALREGRRERRKQRDSR